RKAATPRRLKSVTSCDQRSTLERPVRRGNSTCPKTTQRANWLKEGRLNSRTSREQRLHDQRPVGPRLRPCPRQSRHCESVLLEQMSPLSCYEVKASACSASHSQADIIVRILYPYY